jgi:predicted metal-binding protein
VEIIDEIEKAKEIQRMALAFEGIIEAKIIHTRDIVVNERVRFQCSYSG